MIWYRAYFDNIIPVDVVKETDSYVVIKNSNGKEYRAKKSSEYDSYHKTKEEAFNWLVERQKNKIAQLKYKIECHEKKIIEILNTVKITIKVKQ